MAVVTPPTQWMTSAMVTLRIGFGIVLAGGGAVSGRGDAVPDGDLLGSDEDVLNQEPEHPLAFGDAGGGGCADQLLGVGLDHGGDRAGSLGRLEFEAVPLAGDRVGGAGRVQPLADLGPDEGGVGEQAGDVVPHDGVEVVGADRLVAADPPAVVPVVIRSQAPVVADRLVRGPGGGPVIAVPARLACGQALQQGGDPGVARGVPLVVFQPLPGPLKRAGVPARPAPSRPSRSAGSRAGTPACPAG